MKIEIFNKIFDKDSIYMFSFETNGKKYGVACKVDEFYIKESPEYHIVNKKGRLFGHTRLYAVNFEWLMISLEHFGFYQQIGEEKTLVMYEDKIIFAIDNKMQMLTEV